MFDVASTLSMFFELSLFALDQLLEAIRIVRIHVVMRRGATWATRQCHRCIGGCSAMFRKGKCLASSLVERSQ